MVTLFSETRDLIGLFARNLGVIIYKIPLISDIFIAMTSECMFPLDLGEK